MHTSSTSTAPSLPVRAWRAWLGMMQHMMLPTLFFFLGFNLILWTMHLILARHGIDVSGFVAATLAALLVGKAVLLTDKLPFMARFDGAPLIQPILFKSLIYWLCTFVVRAAEILIHYGIDHGTLQGFSAYLVENFDWRRFTAIQVWLMVLFATYVTLRELDQLFGGGELMRVLVRWNNTQAKLTRRGRIRLLVRLSRLAESSSVEQMAERGTPEHAELVDILQALAKSDQVASGTIPAPPGLTPSA